jgi:hypothetical protein
VKSPKMSGPSQAELDAQTAQVALLKKQTEQLDQQEAQRKADAQASADALTSGRSGMRSLLSSGWSGFTRGGDLGAKS